MKDTATLTMPLQTDAARPTRAETKFRETNVYGGLPIAEWREDMHCGVAVFDFHSKHPVSVLLLRSGLEEILAVDVVPGFTIPLFPGAVVDNQSRDVWVLPPQQSVPANS